MTRATIWLMVPLLAGGCMGSDGYPSLLPRSAETTGFDEPTLPDAAAAAPDPETDAQIAAAQKTIFERNAAFVRVAADAERKARMAASAAAGSDPWLDAQIALAELDALRSDTQAALVGLEDAAADRAGALKPAYPALDAAIERGTATVRGQTERIATIQALLPSER